MATSLKNFMAKVVIYLFITFILYLAGVAVYSLLYGQSFIYTIGYSLGYAGGLISSWFS